MSLITLVTDFGLQDEYVGILKGVILGINPEARIVDLSHAIEPQNVGQAAYLLDSAYPYFPRGTIHMAVVDPGVGSQRAILAAQCGKQIFLAPDNGLLSGVWDGNPPEVLVRVENTALFRHPVSNSFHGRDIFAPVAAHLSLGMDMGNLGPAMAWDQAVTLPIPTAKFQGDDCLCGQVIAIDHFGNLVTNITAAQMSRFNPDAIAINIGKHCVQGLSTHYCHAGAGQALALIGSRSLLEIAVNQSNAAQRLNVSKGESVFISIKEAG